MGRANPLKLAFLVRRPDTGHLVYHRKMPVRWAPFIVGDLSLSWSVRSYALKGQATIKISLGTTDARQGEIRRDEIHAALQPIISKAKQKIDGAASRPTSIRMVTGISAAQQQHMLDQIKHGILADDDESVLHPERDPNGLRHIARIDGINAGIDDPSYGGTRRGFVEDMEEIARNALNTFDIESVTENCAFEDEGVMVHPVADVDELLNYNGLALPEKHPQRRELALNILRARAQAWQQVRSRLDGVPVLTPDPPAPLTAPVLKADGPLLSEVFENYKAERKPARKTVTDYALYVDRFTSLFGDLAVKSITRTHIRDFKNALVKCPAVIPPSLAGKSFAEAIVWAEAHPDAERLSAQTINDRGLGSISAILGWAMSNDLIEVNPRRGIKVPESKLKGDKRRPYDMNDLRLIFTLPVFGEPAQRPRAGAGEAARWIPLIALFTGARLQEIGQLLVADFREEDGIHFFDMTSVEEATDISASRKNEASRRRVPIHAELKRFGLMAYVEEQRRTGKTRLFPEIASTRETLTAGWSKWYGRYIRAAGLTDPKKVFHSFRHTAKDRFRDCEVEESVARAIMGHEGSGTASKYGKGYSLAKLNSGLQQLAYPGLDLSHLVPVSAAAAVPNKPIQP